MTKLRVGTVGDEEEFIIGGVSHLGCPITIQAMSGPSSVVRPAIVAALEAALTDVQPWPYLPSSLPHVPAVVLRRNAYPAKAAMGAGDMPSYDAICIVDMATEERIDDLDALVDLVVPVLQRLEF